MEVEERVEHTAIGDGVERLPTVREFERRRHLEPGGRPPGDRLLAGAPDRRRGKIDPPRVVAVGGIVEGVLPGPAADIEHSAPDLSVRFQLNELPLRPGDLPRGVSFVRAVEVVHRGLGEPVVP